MRINEVTKKSISKASDELAKLTQKMKDMADEYKKAKAAGDNKKVSSIVDELKKKTKEKQRLSKELDAAVAKLDKNAKLDVKESKNKSMDLAESVRESIAKLIAEQKQKDCCK